MMECCSACATLKTDISVGYNNLGEGFCLCRACMDENFVHASQVAGLFRDQPGGSVSIHQCLGIPYTADTDEWAGYFSMLGVGMFVPRRPCTYSFMQINLFDLCRVMGMSEPRRLHRWMAGQKVYYWDIPPTRRRSQRKRVQARCT